MMKTHFLYIDPDSSKKYQVALGWLPYVPRKGEDLTLVWQDKATSLWDQMVTFRVERVAYELFGTTLPVSCTWENDTRGEGCQVVLQVVPNYADRVTMNYVQRVIEADEGR